MQFKLPSCGGSLAEISTGFVASHGDPPSDSDTFNILIQYTALSVYVYSALRPPSYLVTDADSSPNLPVAILAIPYDLLNDGHLATARGCVHAAPGLQIHPGRDLERNRMDRRMKEL
jgi:hypothetical protein